MEDVLSICSRVEFESSSGHRVTAFLYYHWQPLAPYSSYTEYYLTYLTQRSHLLYPVLTSDEFILQSIIIRMQSISGPGAISGAVADSGIFSTR